MPELPEVEIGTRAMRGWLAGKRIDRAIIDATRVIRPRTPLAIARLLEGRIVESIDRRGKWMRLSLSGATRAFSHLGMSGKWVARGVDAPPLAHERLRIDAVRGRAGVSVRYVDPRLFGRFVIGELPEWSTLGPDPLVDGLDPSDLWSRLSATRRTVKEALLDQTLVAGLGNIQVTEALFRARIAPTTRACDLDRRTVGRLVRAIDASIAWTLSIEGGPEITYVEEAGATNPFPIYGRGGQPCPRCRTALVRSVLGGRGTVHCKVCQPTVP